MLRREIAVLLTIKLIALAGLWYFFFRPELKVRVDPPAVEQHLFETGSRAPGNGS
ncbi:cytochrome oxidase putative small subunit CydP [Oleomonas cavernae]|uniref:cytochrome oxidase putative small subunit CydP n=1 Tax=Oleomonas cavernae TaxID=2320859 RepID=UPI001314C622|nr:cytochrome oxidase putative small subunit CydP [Oleomonas cavernae]